MSTPADRGAPAAATQPQPPDAIEVRVDDAMKGADASGVGYRVVAGLHWVWDLAVSQWFILGVGLAIGLAAAVPDLARNGGWIRGDYTIKYGAVIVIFLLSGMSLKTRALLVAAQRAHLHLFIQALCLGLTPLIGYGIARALRKAPWINQDLVSGLIVCTSMPTTVSTNVVFTRQAGGSEPVALINAVIGNIIGIFVSPSLLLLYLGKSGQAPFSNVLTTLTETVIAPLVVGQVLQFVAPQVVKWLQLRVNFSHVSNIMILLLVWNTFSGTFASNISAGGGSLALVIAMCILLYPLFTIVCFCSAAIVNALPGVSTVFAIDRPDAVAIMMCGATKTLALGMPLIGVLYGKQPNVALLALPLIVYHASQILQGNLLIGPMKRWVSAVPLAPAKGSGPDEFGDGGLDMPPGPSSDDSTELEPKARTPPPPPPPPLRGPEDATGGLPDIERGSPALPPPPGPFAPGLQPAPDLPQGLKDALTAAALRDASAYPTKSLPPLKVPMPAPAPLRLSGMYRARSGRRRTHPLLNPLRDNPCYDLHEITEISEHSDAGSDAGSTASGGGSMDVGGATSTIDITSCAPPSCPSPSLSLSCSTGQPTVTVVIGTPPGGMTKDDRWPCMLDRTESEASTSASYEDEAWDGHCTVMLSLAAAEMGGMQGKASVFQSCEGQGALRVPVSNRAHA